MRRGYVGLLSALLSAACREKGDCCADVDEVCVFWPTSSPTTRAPSLVPTLTPTQVFENFNTFNQNESIQPEKYSSFRKLTE